MTTITEKLAEALLGMTRALDLKYPGTDHKPGHWREPYDAAMAALAFSTDLASAANRSTTSPDSSAAAAGARTSPPEA